MAWTPYPSEIETRQNGGEVELGVWGRRYVLSGESLVERITALNAELLAAPVTLTAEVGANPWSGGPRGRSVAEFDGYFVFDCELTANRDTMLDGLTLDQVQAFFQTNPHRYGLFISLDEAAEISDNTPGTLRKHVSEGRYDHSVVRGTPLRFLRDQFCLDVANRPPPPPEAAPEEGKALG